MGIICTSCVQNLNIKNFIAESMEYLPCCAHTFETSPTSELYPPLWLTPPNPTVAQFLSPPRRCRSKGQNCQVADKCIDTFTELFLGTFCYQKTVVKTQS